MYLPLGLDQQVGNRVRWQSPGNQELEPGEEQGIQSPPDEISLVWGVQKQGV